MSTYRISKEQDGWAVSRRGLIQAAFEHKHEAENYRAAQLRADEQSKVLGSFNDEQEMQALLCELAEELAA